MRAREVPHHLVDCFSILNLPYFCFHFTWSAQRVQQPAMLAPTAVSTALFVFSFTLMPRSGWNGVTFWCTRVCVWAPPDDMGG